MDENSRKKLKNHLSKIIGISQNDITDDSGMGKTVGWDSLKHMEIVLLVEEKYGIRPTADRVVQMMTYQGICRILDESRKIEKVRKFLTEEDFIEGLKSVGLKRGDHLFVQSSVGTFGMVKNSLETFKRAFLSVIGGEGTLAVPTFNFGFCKGENFNIDKTESETGVFSEYIRKLPNAIRSQHPPFHSIAAIGKYAQTLGKAISSTSFSKSSVFGKMYDLNFKICMFGTTLRSNTFFHYVEEQVGVPYRFFKTFASTVTCQTITEQRSYNYYARYLEPVIKNDFHNIGEKLLEEFNGRKVFVGSGPIYLFPSRKFVDVISSYLSKDPTFLIREQDKCKVQKMIAKPL